MDGKNFFYNGGKYMLQINNLNLIKRGTNQILLQDFSFALNKGDKIALISEEGNGKSSLLKTIINKEAVDDYLIVTGDITTSHIVGYLPQFLENQEQSIQTYFKNYQDYEFIKYFNEFKIDIKDYNRLLNSLSGGEKIKLQIIKLLLKDPDFLLLDEPSNDLDIETLEWLESFINSFEGGILFVSHDEVLLENCANGIIHIEQLIKKTKPKHSIHKLDYKSYVLKRQELYDRNMMIASKQREDYKEKMEKYTQILQKVHHAQSTITRQDPSTGRLLKKKMKSVISTGKRFEREKENFLEIPDQEESIIAKFEASVNVPQGKTLLDLKLDKLTIGNKVLSNDIELLIKGPTKIGIIGQNGSGKSTLLRIIKDNIISDSVGYMPQNYQETLDMNLDAVSFIHPYQDKTLIRKFLGAMKFTHQEMESPIGNLSGGQQAKILFLKMVYDKNDVLVLDEPTRNFSPLSNPEIRKALKEFNGCIISVSHDRKYLKEVCDKVLNLDKNGLVSVLK